MRAAPGEWQLVHTYDARATAQNTGRLIETASRNMHIHYAPPGAFETGHGPAESGGTHLYARYCPREEE